MGWWDGDAVLLSDWGRSGSVDVEQSYEVIS